MKKQIVSVMLALAFAGAQAQAPPVVVRGSVGPSGTFPFRNATPITMTDANHTMVYAETSAGFVRLTGTLTAQRDVIEITLTNQQCFQNATTGSQNVRVVGPSGTGVVIASGTYACVQGDGTNYVTTASGSGTVSTVSVTTANGVSGSVSNPTATPAISLTLGAITPTSVASTGPVSGTSLISGTPSAGAVAACTPVSGSHCAVFDESSTAGVPAAGVDYSRADSVTHRFVQSVNGGAESPVVTDLSLASPPAIGNTAPAPSATANLLHATVGCDPATSTSCLANEQEAVNCTIEPTVWYACNWKTHVWTKPNAVQDNITNSFVAGPGIDTGNCDGCNGPIWSGFRSSQDTYVLNRRGLDGLDQPTVYLNRAGDFLSSAHVVVGIGGAQAASDEGVDLFGRVEAYEPTFWTGVLPPSGSIDQTYIYQSELASTNSGATNDYTWVIDTTQQVTGGQLNGSPSASGFLLSVPVTGLTLTTSNWDTCTPGISPATQLPRPTVSSFTVTCTVQNGSITTGWAKVGGSFGEGVMVTAASAPSGGSQTVTLSANLPQPSGFSLWQNPGSGTSYAGYCGWVNDDFTQTGQKPLFQVFGAIDSTHLAIGIQAPGNLNQATFPNTGNSYETTSSPFTIAPCAEVVQNIGTEFTGNLTAGSPTITGISSMTGLAIGQLVFGPGVMHDPQHNLSISSISGSTATLNVNVQATQNGVHLATIGGIQIEPHAWTLNNSDHLENPHSAYPILEAGLWGHVLWETPAHHGTGQGFYFTLCDTHYCGGSEYRAFRAVSELPISDYWGGYYPPNAAMEVGTSNSVGGYYGSGFTMDKAPIHINPNSVTGGIIQANDAEFHVIATTNGTTTVTVTGFPSPSVMCPQVLNQRVVGSDIPSMTTISTCTAGGTNTATLVLSAGATGSHTGIDLAVAYPVEIFNVTAADVSGHQMKLDLSANSGNGKLSLDVAELEIGGHDALTTASGVAGTGTPGKIPLWTGSTAQGDSHFSDSGTAAGLSLPFTINSGANSNPLTLQSTDNNATFLAIKNDVGTQVTVQVRGSTSAIPGIMTFYGGPSGTDLLDLDGTTSASHPQIRASNGAVVGIASSDAYRTLIDTGFSRHAPGIFRFGNGTFDDASAEVDAATGVFSSSLGLASAAPLTWNSDTGFSREFAGAVDLGNGTAGDKSGQLILASINASNGVSAKTFSTNVGTGNNVSILSLGVASGGSNFSSGAFNIGGQYWDGAAHQNDTWTATDAVGTGATPTSILTVTHSGSPGAASISLPAATLPGYAVGSLPSASSLPAGTAVMVTDATTFTVGTCTGGGSDTMLAITNGTTWSCH